MKRKGLENILGAVVLIISIAGVMALVAAWFSGYMSESQEKGSILASEQRGRPAEDLAIEVFDGTNLVLRNVGITNIILTRNGSQILSLYRDVQDGNGFVFVGGLTWEMKNDAGTWVVPGPDTVLVPGRLVRVRGNNLFPFNSRFEIRSDKETKVIFGQGVPNIITLTANPTRIPSNDNDATTHFDESEVAAVIMDLYGNPIAGQNVEFSVLEPNPFDGTLDGGVPPTTVASGAGGAASVILQGDHDMTVRVRATLLSNPSVRGEVRVVVYGTTIIRRDVRAVVYSNGASGDSTCNNRSERPPIKYYMDSNGLLTVTKYHCPMATIGTHNRYMMFEIDLRGTTEEIPKNAVIDSIYITFRHWESFYTSFGAGRNNCGTFREGISTTNCTPATRGGIFSTCWYSYVSGGTTYYVPTGYPIGRGYYSGTGAYAGPPSYQYRWWSGGGCSDPPSTWPDLDDRTNDDVWLFMLDHNVPPHDAANPYTVNGVNREDVITNFIYLDNVFPVGPTEPATSKTTANLQFTLPNGVPYTNPQNPGNDPNIKYIMKFVNTSDDANHFAIAVFFAGNVMPTNNVRYSVFNVNFFQVSITYHLEGAVVV